MGIDTLRKEQKDAYERGQAILEADGDLTDEQLTEASDHFAKSRRIGERVKLATTGGELLKDLGDASGASEAELEAAGKKAAEKSGAKLRGVTPGEMFISGSKEIQALAKAYPNGVSDEVSVNISPVTMNGIGIKQILRSASIKSMQDESQVKVLSDDLVAIGDNTNPASSAGGSTLPHALRPDFLGVIPPVFTPLSLLQLISTVPVSSNVVEWVAEDTTLRTLNAAIVKEAAKTVTASDDGTEIKPQSGFGFAKFSVTVKTIAHWIAVTNTSLSDLPQLRALIDLFLARGLQQKLEDQLVNADGTGLNMTGILHVANTQAQAADTDIFSTSRKALTKLRLAGYTPTGWVMNPADLETLDLQQDANQRYYGNGPYALGPRTLWGLPIAENFTVPQGTALVADWSYVIYFDREDTSVTVGTVNDDFIRNIRRVLAETRGVLGVTQPKAVVVVTLPS